MPARSARRPATTCSSPTPTVSRLPLRDPRRRQTASRIVDLGSRNGTVVDGVQIKEAFLRNGSLLRLGGRRSCGSSSRTAATGCWSPSAPRSASWSARRRRCGRRSRCSSGGRERRDRAARGRDRHRQGRRRPRRSTGRARARSEPFVVVDCGAIPANLLESELFGHEKGAFTGAVARRVGAFEEAAGGTLFLDEIGELPLDLQPKLLRVLEHRDDPRAVGTTRTGRSTSASSPPPTATCAREVNAGRFRADLYFRLAVVRIALPPLRERPEDLPLLVETLLRRLGADAERARALLARRRSSTGLSRSRVAGQRPRAAQLPRALPGVRGADAAGRGPTVRMPGSGSAPAAGAVVIDPAVAYAEARRQALEAFEQAVRARAAGGARRAGVGGGGPRRGHRPRLSVPADAAPRGDGGARARRRRAPTTTPDTKRKTPWRKNVPPGCVRRGFDNRPGVCCR